MSNINKYQAELREIRSLGLTLDPSVTELSVSVNSGVAEGYVTIVERKFEGAKLENVFSDRELTQSEKEAIVAFVSTQAFLDAYQAKYNVAFGQPHLNDLVRFTFPVAVLSQTLGGTSYDNNLDALVSEAVKLGANVSTDPFNDNVNVSLFVSFYNQLPTLVKNLIDPYKL